MNDEREPIPQPPSITVIGRWARRGDPGYRETRGPSRDRLELVRKWPRGEVILLVIGAGCLAFLIFWCALAIAAREWVMGAIALPLVAAALGALYLALSGLLNRTRIVIEGRTLTVRHGPLPWPGHRELDVDRVQQLFVHRRSTLREDVVSVEYALCAQVDGAAIDLLRGLASHDEARFIEQVIEDHLAIADDPRANVLE